MQAEAIQKQAEAAETTAQASVQRAETDEQRLGIERGELQTRREQLEFDREQAEIMNKIQRDLTKTQVAALRSEVIQHASTFMTAAVSGGATTEDAAAMTSEAFGLDDFGIDPKALLDRYAGISEEARAKAQQYDSLATQAEESGNTRQAKKFRREARVARETELRLAEKRLEYEEEIKKGSLSKLRSDIAEIFKDFAIGGPGGALGGREIRSALGALGFGGPLAPRPGPPTLEGAEDEVRRELSEENPSSPERGSR